MDNYHTKKILKQVLLNADVNAMLMQHALLTDKEEIMGMLIGHVDETTATSYISAFKILRREDKQPDRVEISPEQLMSASSYAEMLSNRLNKPMRVVGWYHSHPHITVLPSHVDIRTQAVYQTMDSYFVGLIYSVYPKTTNSMDNQAQVTAFQSEARGSEVNRLDVQLDIVDSPINDFNLEALAELPKILVQEENENHLDDCENLLTNTHNDAIKTIKHTNILFSVTIPMFDALKERLEANKIRIKQLEEIKRLEEIKQKKLRDGR